MNKGYKLSITLFTLLVIVPEILWSPMANFAYSLFQPLQVGSIQVFRHSFLLDNSSVYGWALLVQACGLAGSLAILLLNYKRFKRRGLILALISLLTALTMLAFLMWGLFINLRRIGF